ncbi:hypothetical protein [Pseudonocardia nigra]|uniref:hypothetical protein n=1 Tax=Pseudonocardia nigra TaxID=1921578 RepID=UPI001C5FC6DE|nr:hypothetical protein [Pseudonocardia nigra]
MGLATAWAFAEAGAGVALADVDEASVCAAVELGRAVAVQPRRRLHLRQAVAVDGGYTIR